MIRFVGFVFAMLMSFSCLAQKIGFELKTGYSTYSMRDLNRFQHLQTNFPIPIKVTNDFDGNITGGFSFYYSIHEKVDTGFDYTYHTTLGRVHYKDYSGEIGIDQTAVAHSLGAYTRYEFFERGKFAFRVSAMLSLWRGAVEFRQYLMIGDDQEITQFKVVSTNVGLTAGLEPVYKINEYICIGARLGGMLEIPRPLHLEGERKAILRDEDGNEVHAHWAGFRSELFLGFWISKD